MADEPTAIRHPWPGSPAHRSIADGIELPFGFRDVTGCGAWASDMTDRVPLSQVAPADRCKTCWGTP